MIAKSLFVVMLAVLCFSIGSLRADILDTKSFSTSNISLGTIVEQDSETYSTITLTTNLPFCYLGEPGDPELPSVSYLYSLPYGMEVDEVTVDDYSEQDLCELPHKLHPIQEPWDWFGKRPSFTPPGAIYSDGETYPKVDNLARNFIPVNFSRGAGIANIQIYPIRFDPQNSKLLMLRDISFTISLKTAVKNPSPPLREKDIMRAEFINTLETLVENSGDVVANMPDVDIITNDDIDPCNIIPDCLVITTSGLADSWEDYKNWMTRKGVPTEIVTLDQIYNIECQECYDNAERIRTYLQNRYVNDGISYVVLGGNAIDANNEELVPKRLCYIEGPEPNYLLCDLYFAELGQYRWGYGDSLWGDFDRPIFDFAADIKLARVPAENADDVSNWTEKRIRFEANPGDGDSSYLNKVLVSQEGFPHEHSWWERYIEESIPSFFYRDTETLVERHDYNGQPTSPSDQIAIGALSSGTQIFEIVNHGLTDYVPLCSHGAGGNDQWNLNADELPGITAGKDHITFAISCLLGNIDLADGYWPSANVCFAQVDLVSQGGSVAARYNSRPVPMETEMAGLDAWTLSFFLNDGYHLGDAHYLAKQGFPDMYSPEDRMIIANNLFGCPELRAWTEEPQVFIVEYPDYLHWHPSDSTGYCASDTFTINVTKLVVNQQVPVSGVFVTLWKNNEVYKYDTTNANGNIFFSLRALSEGTIHLTCTKRNMIPFQAEIPLEFGCQYDPEHNEDRPGIGGGKRATLLPALIWNPLHFPSGDSLNQILFRAGYQSTLTDSLALFMDSLSNYHLFIIAGIFEHWERPMINEPLIHPYLSGILSFLANGGSIYWEGAASFSDVDDNSNDTLFHYFRAFPIGVEISVQYLIGRDSTSFENIDSLSYSNGGNGLFYLDGNLGHLSGVIKVGGNGAPLALIAAIDGAHTMLANFSWSRVQDGNPNTRIDLINDIMAWLSGEVGIEEPNPKPIPKEFALSQNYPNPFNAQTTIQYALPKDAYVRLEIFDILGKRVTTLVDGVIPAGYNRITWDASGQASGVYFYKISASGLTQSGRMTLIR